MGKVAKTAMDSYRLNISIFKVQLSLLVLFYKLLVLWIEISMHCT
jgi:hypothetical protein